MATLSDIVGVIHLRKLNEEQRKQIVISHYLDNSNTNIEYLMKEYNISKQGLYNVINSKESKNYITEYKPNLTKKFDKIIENALKKLDAKVLEEDIKPLELTKIIGILYDKSRLESGLSTENKAISININIEK